MNPKAKELAPIVARYVDDPDVVDPCGPSPVMVHLPMLRKLTPEWLRLSFELKRDPEADKIFGWVLKCGATRSQPPSWGSAISFGRTSKRNPLLSGTPSSRETRRSTTTPSASSTPSTACPSRAWATGR